MSHFDHRALKVKKVIITTVKKISSVFGLYFYLLKFGSDLWSKHSVGMHTGFWILSFVPVQPEHIRHENDNTEVSAKHMKLKTAEN